MLVFLFLTSYINEAVTVKFHEARNGVNVAFQSRQFGLGWTEIS